MARKQAVKPAVEPKEETPAAPAELPAEAPVEPKEPKGFCKFCGRSHEKSFDGPGVNHDGFDPDGKPSKMFEALCKSPKVRFFIPFVQGEKVGAVHSVILNGLHINILKGRYVDIPSGVADVLMESLQQTAAASSELKTRNPQTGLQKNARLDLQDSASRNALNG